MLSDESDEIEVEAQSLAQERQTAALCYVVPFLAVPILINVRATPYSEWARMHARHALLFMSVGTVAIFFLAAMPLLLLGLWHLVDTQSILILYTISFVLDMLGITYFLLCAFRAARRAARGEPAK